MSTESGSIWGELSGCESYGRHGDSKDDYKILEYKSAKTDYKTYQHGAHAMLYARDGAILWNLYNCRAAVLMQMRFDGLIGFPGGLVDPGEDPLMGLNREMEEEIGLDLNKHAFCDGDHLISFVHEKKRLVLHFYVKEVAHQDFRKIEEGNLKASDYGSETLGILRPPLFTMGDKFRGLPAFLSNQFAGNAREELIHALVSTKLLTEKEVSDALESCEQFKRSQ